MSEANDWVTIKKHLPRPGDRLDRIENFLLGAGMPDINGCFCGKEFWIESKHPKEPKRPTTPLFGSNHRVSQDQANWFLRQRNAGGRCYFLICTDKRRLLIGGEWADAINALTVQQLCDIALWHVPVPTRGKIPWEKLHKILTA